MPESPNPGAGGSYRYNPTTDKTELVDFTFDPYAPARDDEIMREADPEPEPVVPANTYESIDP